MLTVTRCALQSQKIVCTLDYVTQPTVSLSFSVLMNRRWQGALTWISFVVKATEAVVLTEGFVTGICSCSCNSPQMKTDSLTGHSKKNTGFADNIQNNCISLRWAMSQDSGGVSATGSLGHLREPNHHLQLVFSLVFFLLTKSYLYCLDFDQLKTENEGANPMLH